jgi:hypothetical protein
MSKASKAIDEGLALLRTAGDDPLSSEEYSALEKKLKELVAVLPKDEADELWVELFGEPLAMLSPASRHHP